VLGSCEVRRSVRFCSVIGLHAVCILPGTGVFDVGLGAVWFQSLSLTMNHPGVFGCGEEHNWYMEMT
jgi:hypothetical protein